MIMVSSMTQEEKKTLNKERQKAVREAWKNEKNLVQQGKGTRNWSESQQKELCTRGAVKGYDGHHMKSVSKYPRYAGNPKNIQFLTEKEHYNAHGGNFKKPTNGYYDPKTGTMHNFKGNELKSVPIYNLNKLQKTNSNFSKQDNNLSRKTDQKKCENFRNSINKSSLNNKNIGRSSNSNSKGSANTNNSKGNKR